MSGSIFKLQNNSEHFKNAKIWTIVFDTPGEKVNKLSRKVMEEFGMLVPELEAMVSRGEVDAFVLESGKAGNFIAGADIEMIQTVKTVEEGEALSAMGHKLMARWEDMSVPTIAAIDGAALGGGFEFALSSTAIVMSNDAGAKVGLPEVNLGLIPGMGGCVRLPRKVGLATSLDMILTGKMLTGDRAYRAGIIDAVLPKENFKETALNWTSTNLDALRSGKRIAKEPKLGGMGGIVGSVMEKTPLGRMIILKKAREGVLAKTKGNYPSALEAVAVIHDTHARYGKKLKGSAREKATAREAQGFGKMAITDVSQNLIRIFFMTENVKKSKGLTAGVDAEPTPIHSGAVLGAGVMGGGIAQLFADKNHHVRMKDINVQALTTGMQSASRIFYKQVQQKRLNKRQYLQKLDLIAPIIDYSGFKSVDIVVEAIVENLEIKQKVLRELEDQIRDNCVMVSNTSSLSISKMQSVLKHPERFAGMHFFNPVHRMPLVEVIRGDKSSNEAVSAVFQLSKQLGKTPIVVKDAPGFLVNRLLMPYLNEATYLLADGAPIPEIDRALLKFGMPMGPMELIDEVGIDVAAKVGHVLNEAFGSRAMASPLNDKVVKAGRLGKKNLKGLYVYAPGGRDKKLDESVYEILGVTPRKGAVSFEEMIDRCIMPMINEASRCLEEGIVASASEVDLGMIMGTGFPPFRGGLLRYADSLGAKVVVEKLNKYKGRFGARFEPSPALFARAQNDQKFYPN